MYASLSERVELAADYGEEALKKFCMNRLPVRYLHDAPEPSRWIALLGDSMNTGSIQKVEIDCFASADIEWKLLTLDDDMKLEALPQTNNIKSIVTLED